MSGPRRIWLCDLTHNQQSIASNTVPLGVGMIAAALGQRFEDRIEVRLFKMPEDLDAAFAQDGPPDAVGFGDYCWNHDLNVGFARAIKARYPRVVTLAGGPNYPREADKRAAFLESYGPALDFFVRGEGEEAVARLVARLIEVGFDAAVLKTGRPLDQCAYLWEGRLIEGPRLPRLNVSDLPSPYLAGLLDDYLRGEFMPLLQTTRGCPFSCAYCVEGSPEYRRVSRRTAAQIAAEFEYVASRRPRVGNVFVADSNFGLFPGDLDTARVIARMYHRYGWPQFLHAATAKIKKERVLELVRVLEGRMRISASIQTSDPEVLANVHRQNVPVHDLLSLTREANLLGGNTYSELILALPGDTRAKHFKSIEDVAALGINVIRPFTLMLLPGAELETSAARRRFQMATRFRVLPRCFGLYHFADIPIPAVEIEEVVVAGEGLTFEDYLDCRRFALVVELFYNEGQNRELFRFLAGYGLEAFDFLTALWERLDDLPSDLADLFRRYEAETRSELWASRAELEGFARQPANLRRYLNNELGRNLLFSYKAEALDRHLDAVLEVAYRLADELLARTVSRDEAAVVKRFLENMHRFAFCRGERLLDVDFRPRAEFDFAVRELFEDPSDGPVPIRRLERPAMIEFSHDPEQVKLIESHRAEFGDDEVGRARIFSRLPTNRVWRRAREVAAPEGRAG